MRPPICAICRKRFSASKTEGGLVYFKLTEEEEASNNQMKERRMVGHPKGREWFCEDHRPIAKKYKDLSRAEAIAIIRQAQNDKPKS